MNARLLVSAAGAVTDAYGFKAFGEGLNATQPTPNPFRFGGEVRYYADNPSFLLAGARHLRPDLGRWNSRDPIGFDGGINLYLYVGNNPVVRNDPRGLSPFTKSIKMPILRKIIIAGGVLIPIVIVCQKIKSYVDTGLDIKNEIECTRAIQEDAKKCREEIENDPQYDDPENVPTIGEGESGNMLQTIHACVERKLRARHLDNLEKCLEKLAKTGFGSYTD